MITSGTPILFSKKIDSLPSNITKRYQKVQADRMSDGSGFEYHHAGILYVTEDGIVKVVEAVNPCVKKRVLINHYDLNDYNIIIGVYKEHRLRTKITINEESIKYNLDCYLETPYEYYNLLIWQQIKFLLYLTTDKLISRKQSDKRSKASVICGELVGHHKNWFNAEFKDAKSIAPIDIYLSDKYNWLELDRIGLYDTDFVTRTSKKMR